MTELLEEAVAKVRKLPAQDQKEAGKLLRMFAEQGEEPEELDREIDEETRAAIREGLAQAERGEFVGEQDMAALLARFRG